ncbi:MAG: metal ABC transporter ATP-binding protein [Acidobacteria bacterium]|nr:metal ABC transporter ATP-binding protein [Acidobacteriota bacterium]
MENVLAVSNLSVKFGSVTVLSGLSFTVPRGAALAIIGPNGAGKTVLFRALIGAVPCEGEVRWGEGTRIGYVPQKLDLDRDVPITALDFLRARAQLAHLPSTGIGDAMQLVGIPSEVARQPVGTLSIGQFQRILLAFALVGNPNVLMLDEPTAGVDEPGQERLNELVQRLQREQGLTVMFISHELSIVNRYATNVLCLNRRVTCFGPPQQVLTPERLQEIYGASINFYAHEH